MIYSSEIWTALYMLMQFTPEGLRPYSICAEVTFYEMHENLTVCRAQLIIEEIGTLSSHGYIQYTCDDVTD